MLRRARSSAPSASTMQRPVRSLPPIRTADLVRRDELPSIGRRAELLLERRPGRADSTVAPSIDDRRRALGRPAPIDRRSAEDRAALRRRQLGAAEPAVGGGRRSADEVDRRRGAESTRSGVQRPFQWTSVASIWTRSARPRASSERRIGADRRRRASSAMNAGALRLAPTTVEAIGGPPNQSDARGRTRRRGPGRTGSHARLSVRRRVAEIGERRRGPVARSS